MSILDKINSREDFLALPESSLPELCAEIRRFLIDSVSKTGGHLASSLGAVELTVALHRVYNPDTDRILFDVGHQAYIHKLLTGRKDGFDTLRTYGGLSGFPRPDESPADPFIAGHASEAVSISLGMARARTMLGKTYDVAAVVGDGALTGGLCYEGFCDAGSSGEPMVVILNDNEMSINPNVGGVARFLSRMRVRPAYLRFKKGYRATIGKIPGLYRALHKFKEWLKVKLLPPNIFDAMGMYYIGPVDGHDVSELITVLKWAKEMNCPVLVHAQTKKGKGYPPAEDNPSLYHGVGPFDPKVGVLPKTTPDFSSVFGNELCRLAEENSQICAMTAAMEDGTGLSVFASEFPSRYFELGIVEGHAVSLCGGLAKQGMIPVFAVYSAFLQRSYDMLIEDTGLMSLHCVFAVDRAGLVGQDGPTHHGVFDIAYLSSVPNMVIYAPSSYVELRSMLKSAVLDENGPVAVRYSRGSEGNYKDNSGDESAVVLRRGTDATLAVYGIMINEALDAADLLEMEGISVEIVKLNRIWPVPSEAVLDSVAHTGRLIVAEEACEAGCIGRWLLSECGQAGKALCSAVLINLGSGVVTHGSVADLRRVYSLDAEGISRRIREAVKQ